MRHVNLNEGYVPFSYIFTQPCHVLEPFAIKATKIVAKGSKT